MIEEIRKAIDKELASFLDDAEKKYAFSSISPLLGSSLREYVLRDGKRVRPSLFILLHDGYFEGGTPPKGLYRSAIATELLHAFLLIHDDIVDRSEMRRGLPAMHRLLDAGIKELPFLSFNGDDLAIILGDIVYSLAIEAFLSIETDPTLKERAFLKFVESALLTGCGEFIEMLAGAKKVDDVSRETIYSIYDFKTSHYTFVSPMLAGAILANAPNSELEALSELGLSLGRAFQINDDILGVFGDEKITGKSSLTDIAEKKKTLLLFHAYQNARPTQKEKIEMILSKNDIETKDLDEIKQIMVDTGSLGYAKSEIERLREFSFELLLKTKVKETQQKDLTLLIEKILPKI